MIIKNFRFFSAMLGHPEERDRVTPIFRYKILAGKRMNIFP